VLVELPFGVREGAAALSPDGGHLVTVTQFGARAWNLDDLARRAIPAPVGQASAAVR
jgi:hypothetical protein